MLCFGEVLMKDYDARLLQVEIYLHEFINLYCVKGDQETCMMSEFKNRFQNYTSIVYPIADVTIAKVMITKLKYSSISKNSSRYYKGLSLKE